MSTARAAETRAASLLLASGYEILGSQVRTSYPLWIDGDRSSVELRADYVVARRGVRYVAEVKSGRVAPSLAHGPTRRQLLEYRLAFDVGGVLLVDAEADCVHAVVFPDVPKRATGRGALVWAAVVFAVAIVAALLSGMSGAAR
jgi:hypothetical protein